MFDPLAFEEIDYKQYEYDYLLTRTLSIDHVDRDDPKTCFVEFIDDIKQVGQHFTMSPSTLTNSSAMAVNILGQFGIKRIYLAGIDGGAGRHEMFMQHPSAQFTLTYDRHKLGMDHWAKYRKIELVKLWC